MAQEDDESVPLEQFIRFLVKDTLPRTIEIVQGLYGDEMSSLSTGQRITITNVKLHHVIGKLKHPQGGMELTVQIPTNYAEVLVVVGSPSVWCRSEAQCCERAGPRVLTARALARA
uniref:protein THEMIS2 n=1 Tax=Myxine glutinosa TaxID=7769 RepID=UPI00358EBE5A